MTGDAFQLHKVRRQIRVQGRDIKFVKYKRNDFGEPSEEIDQELTFKGLYHEITSHTLTSGGTGSTTTNRIKYSPMILMLWEDARQITNDFVTEINEKRYKITTTRDLTELMLVMDVYLEEIEE